jgi:hypothetical protein
MAAKTTAAKINTIQQDLILGLLQSLKTAFDSLGKGNGEPTFRGGFR